MFYSEFSSLQTYILRLEQEGLVTRTFRRLDPKRQLVILDAVMAEAAERGPANLNIKQVAKRAGVAVGSLYQYFTDREKMVSFCVELCVRTINDAFNEYRPYLVELPLRQALEAYLLGGIEWGRTQTSLLQLFARGAYQGGPALTEQLVRPIAENLRSMVHDILEQALQRGEIRPEVDLEAATRLVHALTIAVGDSQLLPYLNDYFQVVDSIVTPERSAQALLDLILRGIGKEVNTPI